MTRERKLAIQMWEQIVEALEQGKHDTKYARPIVSVIKDATFILRDAKTVGCDWIIKEVVE